MTIVAHILSFYPPTAHLAECLVRIAEQNPNIKIVFFSSTGYKEKLPGNCMVQIISPAIKSSILLHYWYNYKLPGLLKEANADIFISENAVLSFKTGIKQIMLLPEWFTDDKINYASFKNYRKRFFRYFLKKAAMVLTANPVLEQQLKVQFPKIENIQTTFFGINSCYHAINDIEQQIVKEKYSNEKDFFAANVSAGNQQDIIHLLKAFSIFKKWHKSEMKLALLLHHLTGLNAIPNLPTYRFKEDVIIINGPGDLECSAIVASAYAFIYLPEKIITGNFGLYALKCGVPLLTYKNNNTFAAFGEAAIYAAKGESGLAEQLSELYKNESLKNNFTQKGIEHTQLYNWKNASSILFKAIQ